MPLVEHPMTLAYASQHMLTGRYSSSSHNAGDWYRRAPSPLTDVEDEELMLNSLDRSDGSDQECSPQPTVERIATAFCLAANLNTPWSAKNLSVKDERENMDNFERQQAEHAVEVSSRDEFVEKVNTLANSLIRS